MIPYPIAAGDLVLGFADHMGLGYEKLPTGFWGLWRMRDGKLIASSREKEAVIAALRLLQ